MDVYTLCESSNQQQTRERPTSLLLKNVVSPIQRQIVRCSRSKKKETCMIAGTNQRQKSEGKNDQIITSPFRLQVQTSPTPAVSRCLFYTLPRFCLSVNNGGQCSFGLDGLSVQFPPNVLLHPHPERLSLQAPAICAVYHVIQVRFSNRAYGINSGTGDGKRSV